jgi:hypothetical protein
MARLENSGEIVLHNFSQKAVVDAQLAKAESVKADTVALLRSDVELHKHLIRKLFNFGE